MGQGELRLQALRKQLKRTTVQCDALTAEVAEGKRRDRTADLYKKKVCSSTEMQAGGVLRDMQQQ